MQNVSFLRRGVRNWGLQVVEVKLSDAMGECERTKSSMPAGPLWHLGRDFFGEIGI